MSSHNGNIRDRSPSRGAVTPLARRALAVAIALCSVLMVANAASAATLVRLAGSGSTWSQNAVDQWIANVAQYNMRIDYAGAGSSTGRQQFSSGVVDFAVSEIPYGMQDGASTDSPPRTRGYAYMPIVAGGTAFMYNLRIGTTQVTNLRLSGEVIARIFTGAITTWNHPEIAADNPGLTLPATPVRPVVRSDGSGTSAQFTAWMLAEHGGVYRDFCARANRNPCTATSNYPRPSGTNFQASPGSLGVAGYVSSPNAVGSITYVEYSYALNADFPVAKVLNGADYYVEPTPNYVAVALLQADLNRDESSPMYLTQELEGVYRDDDRRSYPLSSYSYMVLPTDTRLNFSTDKGYTLGEFANYFLCQGQQQAPDLGYSPLPVNLVQAGFDQVRRIPGAQADRYSTERCNNPTLSPTGGNRLAEEAPNPPACDRRGPQQCSTGTGGARQETPTRPGGEGGGGGANGGADGDGPGGAGGGGAGGDGAAGGGDGDGDPQAAGGGDGVLTDADGNPLIDPETGLPLGQDPGAAGGALPVAAMPVSMAARSGWSLQHTLMALAGFALLGVAVGPPLISRLLDNRKGVR